MLLIVEILVHIPQMNVANVKKIARSDFSDKRTLIMNGFDCNNQNHS